MTCKCKLNLKVIKNFIDWNCWIKFASMVWIESNYYTLFDLLEINNKNLDSSILLFIISSLFQLIDEFERFCNCWQSLVHLFIFWWLSKFRIKLVTILISSLNLSSGTTLIFIIKTQDLFTLIYYFINWSRELVIFYLTNLFYGTVGIQYLQSKKLINFVLLQNNISKICCCKFNFIWIQNMIKVF